MKPQTLLLASLQQLSLLEWSYVLAVLSGILSHLSIFIRHEWHMAAPALVWTYSCLYIILFCFVYANSHSRDVTASFKYTTVLSASYSTGLFTSMIVYRRYFHRLRSFPGPWPASISKLWHVWKCLPSKNHILLEQLQKRYGAIIRTGPEELTIINPSIIPLLDGPGNKCEKTSFYDCLLPEVAVNSTRSKKEHDIRRKMWDQGFNAKALAQYERRIVSHTETLISQFAQISREGGNIIVTDWFYWYAFDLISDVAFSRSSNMLRDGRPRAAATLMRRAMSLLGPFSHVPWLARIVFHFFPTIHHVREWFTMLDWCKQHMHERIKNTSDQPDLSHWLIKASLEKGSIHLDQRFLNGDAIAIFIAGSDTVALTLVFAAYELARDQARQELLLQELRRLGTWDRDELQRCDYLNAVIQETLRLHPAVPTGGYRKTGPAGIMMNDIYIPGDITIVVPRYLLSRSEDCYEQAGQWIPERWTTQKEMVKDARAFSPFSQGRYGCVGKSLAMTEMRLVIALLVTKFRIDFSEIDQGQRLFTGLRDQFTAAPGKLELKFHPRT